MKCPQCEADNAEGKRFCADCGSLLDKQLTSFIRSQVRECVEGQFKDQKVVELETTEAIAARFQKWSTWFLVPATILYTLLAAVLTVLGISDYSKIHRATADAIKEANTAVAGANRSIEGKLADLDKSVLVANKAIDEQEKTLKTTSDLTASLLVSKGEQAVFTSVSPARRYEFKLFPDPPGAWVYLLLKSVPVFQTIQLQTGRSLEPRWTYRQEGNVIIFRWHDEIANLRQEEVNVGYVPDPSVHTAPYHSLSLRDGHVWASGVGGDKQMPEFPSDHPNALGD